jgi:hypothetical protein
MGWAHLGACSQLSRVGILEVTAKLTSNDPGRLLTGGTRGGRHAIYGPIFFGGGMPPKCSFSHGSMITPPFSLQGKWNQRCISHLSDIEN